MSKDTQVDVVSPKEENRTTTPAEPPVSSTYEKLGQVDTSVYTVCQYEESSEKTSTLSLCPDVLLKGNQKLRRFLFVACAVALLALLLVSLLLGVIGTAKSCCTTKCRAEEASSSLTLSDMNQTAVYLPMRAAVSISMPYSLCSEPLLKYLDIRLPKPNN